MNRRIVFLTLIALMVGSLLLTACGEEDAYGPQGPVGPQGRVGPQGDVGPKGPVGPQGDLGPKGDPGPKGQLGPQGDLGPKSDLGPKDLDIKVDVPEIRVNVRDSGDDTDLAFIVAAIALGFATILGLAILGVILVIRQSKLSRGYADIE